MSIDKQKNTLLTKNFIFVTYYIYRDGVFTFYISDVKKTGTCGCPF